MAPTSSATPSGTRSRATSNQSQYYYDPSISSDEPPAEYVVTRQDEKKRGSKSRWVGQVKSWLATSEPSSQAMKEQKKATYKKHGVDIKDPQAAAKMHFPLGKLPADVITSTSGPTPEKAFMEKARAKEARSSYVRHSQGSHSTTSDFSSVPSVKGNNPIAPWEN